MGNIYKRKNVWYVDLRVKGKRIRRRIGPSKKIAELALKEAEVQAARDEFGFTKSDVTIDDFVNRYLKHSQVNHRSSTTTRYRAVTDHFRRFVNSSRRNLVVLSQIKPEVIEEYKAYRKSALINPNGQAIDSESDVTKHTRKGARAKTINFELSALRTLFGAAVKWGYIKSNPATDVTKLKSDRSRLPRFLTEDECRLLLSKSPIEFRPILFTLLNTGMREGELVNLKWSDIDLERRRISIRFKDDWKPKSGEREIPLNNKMFELLKNQESVGLSKNGYVFSNPDGSKLRGKLRVKLIKIAKSAGIPELTKLHTLRHTFASQLVMKGVDLATVKELLGHSDIQTTMIYAHLSEGHVQKAVENLDFG